MIARASPNACDAHHIEGKTPELWRERNMRNILVKRGFRAS
jgi:hypothetical protein